MKLNTEIEKCWVTLCDTWSRNLSSCLEFLLALLSVHSTEELMKSTRLVISYLARAKSSKVIKFLIKECQVHVISLKTRKCLHLSSRVQPNFFIICVFSNKYEFRLRNQCVHYANHRQTHLIIK